mmetsp:Transcript_28337/g.77796  ORF Transcript_28337/g.77796 Transcript_28337/m.77796 type:complete len:263 (+) Transcript_28337:192-980(+)
MKRPSIGDKPPLHPPPTSLPPQPPPIPIQKMACQSTKRPNIVGNQHLPNPDPLDQLRSQQLPQLRVMQLTRRPTIVGKHPLPDQAPFLRLRSQRPPPPRMTSWTKRPNIAKLPLPSPVLRLPLTTTRMNPRTVELPLHCPLSTILRMKRPFTGQRQPLDPTTLLTRRTKKKPFVRIVAAPNPALSPWQQQQQQQPEQQQLPFSRLVRMAMPPRWTTKKRRFGMDRPPDPTTFGRRLPTATSATIPMFHCPPEILKHWRRWLP